MSRKEIPFTAYVATLEHIFYGILSATEAFRDIENHTLRCELNNREPLISLNEEGIVIYDDSQTNPFTSPNIPSQVLVWYLARKTAD
ncbi:hypothetical protein HY469_05925 [Candidatus Roizmanbacteria bacterium]|nr:hypothetical protein [Candidatus Roizmanbacteria bacterium]